ncbi:IS5 family transposase [Falsiroseomonas oryzae]|uniref:IS5 family transposase n=1 Tax=Falsiroseomonas oryzae TaxID=2766473 RepID=UPI0022EA9A5F|nr:IS5 family transposase [Roseomonas sp. MO-31]
MVRQPGFFDVEERLRDLPAKSDDLERIAALVDFALFRRELERAVPRADGTKGGRPAFDHVLMFKIPLLQAMHGLSDERCEYLIKDRLSFMRFLGLGLADSVPDANTIWAFREALKRAGAVERLFAQFDATLRGAGYLAMGAQIPEGWAEKPTKLRQKDRDARWTVKFSKAKPREDGAPQVDLAVPAFGYKNHVAIDRRHGLIRGWTASHAAAHDGARLAEVVDAGNTAGDVWGDTGYRSAKNEAWLAERGSVSRIHRKKPPGRPMSARTRQANARKSAVRSAVEHVFARQKGPMGLVVRTIGIARARVKIGLANLAYNIKRLVWLSGRPAPV